ncbi:MAG: glycosyltransferase family 39 protein [Candidatus Curtissbacteria bacterium]|nr:glycosyltransferase family 39 protein [Candidatus Curtissbacteria bacterium]
MKPYLFGLLFIIIFSSAQFGLILRHKSPYLSDSYFYKHLYHRFQGDTDETAREKVMNKIDLSNADNITKNIFEREEVYSDVLIFFQRRPFYPFVAYLTNIIVGNEYLAFLIPVLLSYLGLITVTTYFMKLKFGNLLSLFAISLFISFYPFLDWSTYFLTDTIGAFFWMVQIFFIYKFQTTTKKHWLYLFFILLVISFSNREQSLLMFPLLVTSLVLTKIYNPKNRLLKNFIPIVFVSLIATVLYMLLATILKHRNIQDAIVYTMNSYGFYSNSYSNMQIINYAWNAVVISHVFFLRELVSHHWWFTFSLFASIGAFMTFVSSKKPQLLDILIISSAFASYLAIFIYPVLSYRFFYPVVIAVIYFAFIFIEKYALILNNKFNKS